MIANARDRHADGAAAEINDRSSALVREERDRTFDDCGKAIGTIVLVRVRMLRRRPKRQMEGEGFAGPLEIDRYHIAAEMTFHGVHQILVVTDAPAVQIAQHVARSDACGPRGATYTRHRKLCSRR
jgi:hypothetical protein